MYRIPAKQKPKELLSSLFLLLLLFSATETKIWQTLHLEIMCSSCHLWLYGLNLFQSSSVCIATLLILHCYWRQWKLNFSISHSHFFTHEWGAAAFLNNTCQKSPTSWDDVLMMVSMECVSVACGVTPCYYFLCSDILCECFVVIWQKIARTHGHCYMLTTYNTNK